MKYSLILGVILLFCISSAFASFEVRLYVKSPPIISNLTIEPSKPSVTDNLNCFFDIYSDVPYVAHVTWSNNKITFEGSHLPHTFLSPEEIWTCNVTATNEYGTYYKEMNASISKDVQNSMITGSFIAGTETSKTSILKIILNFFHIKLD